MRDFHAKPRTWLPLFLVGVPIALAVSFLLFGIVVFALVTGAALVAWFLVEDRHFPTRAPKGQDHMTRNPGKGS
ncbi:MAG: hypothetical protein JNL08_20895 [Planctomycetes bacterium]|nr:hypothetical protein [Planctomycetota bacterium]